MPETDTAEMPHERVLPRAAVVVATADTGTNPFHPCWRHAAPPTARGFIPELPVDARPLELQFRDTYEASLTASQATIDAIEDGQLYYVVGTRLLFYGIDGAAAQFVDTYPHGSKASTQIACGDFAFNDDAFVLIINGNWEPSKIPLLHWLAQQQWIDIIHYNFAQGTPYQSSAPDQQAQAFRAIMDSGKFLVLPAGNGIANQWVSYPTEASRITGPPGSLVVGACDQDGWTIYSNWDPHVCPDGGETLAGDAYSFGRTSFSGTSSSSPRAAGYVAELLVRLRMAYNETPAHDAGLPFNISTSTAWPDAGPLADGTLTSEELHMVLRRTADAALSLDDMDGERSMFYMAPADGPFLPYAKAGYGKFTGATFDLALAVLMGKEPLPERPEEDQWYEVSEEIRRIRWGWPPV